jgi:hypothetical protein
MATFTVPGSLVAYTGISRFYFARSATITSVLISVGTPPDGGDVIADVKKNDTTIFTTLDNRPTIGSGQNLGSGSPDVTSVADGDYVTVDVVSVGSTSPGADLVVQIEYTS